MDYDYLEMGVLNPKKYYLIVTIRSENYNVSQDRNIFGRVVMIKQYHVQYSRNVCFKSLR